MTPIEKNIIVVDEQGNILEATYPKRAKGLVKKGRARFISENTICLACPPTKTEENAMLTNENNIDLAIQALVGAEADRSAKLLAEYGEDLARVAAGKHFPLAVALVVETGICKTSLLQRRLHVGYGTAAKLIDLMEAMGLVSALQPVKRSTTPPERTVLPAAKEYLDRLLTME